VIQSTNHQPVTDGQIADVRSKAMVIPGFIEPDNDPAKMWQERPQAPGASKDPSVRVLQNGLANAGDASKKLSELRSLSPPRGIDILVGGTPALEQDSIHSLFAKAPMMLVVLLTATLILMFLAFGSFVLPIKAAVMSALTLGSTMGILTWIFVDGHLSKWLNFTATPLTAPVIALVVAVGYGLATDYEVFLVSRMVEARERGMSTAEAIRIGTATTGRLITAAALVLAVVAGSFVFSDLVMMKYLAFGLMAALLLDATVVRMFLVPAVMKLLGDDCWWAPRWASRLQTRMGLGEIDLPDERKRPVGSTRPPVTAGLVAATPRSPHDPTHPGGPAALEAARPAPGPTRPAVRPQSTPASLNGPFSASTKQMQTRSGQSTEPPTNRLTAPSSAPTPPRSPRPPAQPSQPAPPSGSQTRAMPIPGNRPGPKDEAPRDQGDATAALPVMGNEGDDSDAATEKLNAPGQGDNGDKTRQRRRGGGGGLSAQDLLRREGRF